ncbi:MAG TPA: hypothetical protein VG371_05275, partial [Solirubrobacteraceae bacterium]|nr:hypothetical protein [Solirubrobacteraceae bacterium]
MRLLTRLSSAALCLTVVGLFLFASGAQADVAGSQPASPVTATAPAAPATVTAPTVPAPVAAGAATQP